MLKQITKNSHIFAYFILTLTCLFWAGNFVMGRGVSEIVPPMALSFWRWLLASLILTPFAWRHLEKDWPTIKGHLPYYFLMGFLGGASFNALTYLALHSTTATNALVLNCALALFIVLANFMLHKIKPASSQMIAIIIAIIGIFLIISKGNINNLTTFAFQQGDILVIASMVGWALYTALLVNKPNTHALSFAWMTFISAAIILLPFTILEFMLGFETTANTSTITAIIYAAIFPGLLAYIFYGKAVEIIGGNKAGIMIYLMPLFGSTLSFYFLNETPQSYHLYGFALIIFGVILSSYKK